MADEADTAQQVIEESLQRSIQSARIKAESALPYTGRCHACGSLVSMKKRFCDQECSEEYEWIKSREVANAKV